MTNAKENKDEKSSDKKEEDGSGKKTLSLGGTLSLKGGSPAPSSGRPGIAVEVRRNRRAQPAQRTDGAAAPALGSKDDGLTKAQRDARAKALQSAQESQGRRSTLPKRQGPIEASEQPAGGQSKREALKKELEELEKQKAQEPATTDAAQPNPADIFAQPVQTDAKDKEKESYRDKLKKAPAKPTRTLEDRRNARLTVTQALNKDYERDRGPSLAAQKRAKEKARLAAKGPQEPAAKVSREVIVPEVITVGELSNRMAEPTKEVIKKLMTLGVMATSAQSIDADTAELVITEFDHKIKRVTDADVEIGLEGIEDSEADLITRPPVVTIMGHVDHGKTSLLDAMRNANVVDGEAGGITQHIGAYQIKTKSGQQITFLDTPGHAAFTEMRARGANVTDICVIVVAADDSIMPQTIEAIHHAKAAEVPIIIAVNKIDLPDADPQKVKTELLQHEIVVEDMSGDVQCVEISAKNKTNLDQLEEAIILQAELLELKANPNRLAQGVIVESKLERGRGAVATVLIEKGTLKIGHVFVAGAEFGKIRAILNDQGKNIKEAVPGMPVEILGINNPPDAGDQLNVVEDEARAREVAEYRQDKIKETQAAAAVKNRTTIDDLLLRREEGEKVTLSVVIKGDVHGSVEAIAGSLQKLVEENAEENADMDIEIIHTGVGGITESDVQLARASDGIIIGFNVRANTQARELATRDGVDVRYYNVIYNVIDDAKSILTGMLSPKMREEYIGQAKILEVFNITKAGKIAGCMVEMGAIKRGSKVRLLRDDVVIHEGMLKTLKRFKDEVKEVKEATECGMAFENYEDLKVDDVIECFEIIEEARTVT